jgi:hypothetical protein
MTFMDFGGPYGNELRQVPPSPGIPMRLVSGPIHHRKAVGILPDMPPLYRFALHDGEWHDDPYGTVLDDDDAARKEAVAIAEELARGHDPKRPYTIEVTDGDRLVCIVDWPPA